MDPILLTLIASARSANQKRVQLDNYAREHDLTRQEALNELGRAAKESGDQAAKQFVEDWNAEMSWRDEHRIAGFAVELVDRGGLGGATVRAGRRWLKSKPS